MERRARVIAVTVLAATLAQGPFAAAQVRKCAGDDGRPVYQDAPCAAGRELRNFDSDPPSVSVVPMRPAPGSTTRLTTPAPAAAREKRVSPAAERKARAAPGDPGERRHIRPGMHEGEVMARLGPPDMKSSGRRVARWTYLPVPGDPQTLTTVVFDTGKVIEVERTVVR